MAAGLDKHHPFHNTPAAELIVQNAGLMLAPGTDRISVGYASAVWSLMSNFIVLDRVCATFGAAIVAPGQPVPRAHSGQTDIGTAAPVRISALIFTIPSDLDISTYVSLPPPRKYSANSVWLGLRVERLGSTSGQHPTPSMQIIILPKLPWNSPSALLPEESRRL